MRRLSVVAGSLALVVVCAPARRAGAVEDLVTPRTLAMGNSLRAEASGALGPLLNPAGMALNKGYTIEAMYSFRPQDTGSQLLLTIVDSITSRVAAALYYEYIHGSPHFQLAPPGSNMQVYPMPGQTLPPVADAVQADAGREGHETGLSLAVALGDRFSLGATLKYLHVATTATNPPFKGFETVQSWTLDTTTSDAAADGFSLDFGLSARITDALSAAVVGYNLIPLRSVEAPMAMAIALAYRPVSVLTIAYDTVIYFDKYHTPSSDPTADSIRRTTVRTGGGLEWAIASKVPLRVGALYDNGRPGTYISGGIGYLHQQFGIDFGFRQQVQHGNETILALGVRVFLE
jgi:hypothetical protein